MLRMSLTGTKESLGTDRKPSVERLSDADVVRHILERMRSQKSGELSPSESSTDISLVTCGVRSDQ